MGKLQVGDGFHTQPTTLKIDDLEGLPTTEFADGTGTDIRRPSWASEPTRAGSIDVHAAFADAGSAWSDGPTMAYPDGLDVSSAFELGAQMTSEPMTAEMSRSQVDALLRHARGEGDGVPSVGDDVDFGEPTMPRTPAALRELDVDDVLAQLSKQASPGLPLAPPVESRFDMRSSDLHIRAKAGAPLRPPRTDARPAAPTPARRARRGRVADFLAATFASASIALAALATLALVALPAAVAEFDFAVVSGAVGLATLLAHLVLVHRPYWLLVTLATATTAGITAAGIEVTGPVVQWLAGGLLVEALCARMIGGYQRRAG